MIIKLNTGSVWNDALQPVSGVNVGVLKNYETRDLSNWLLYTLIEKTDWYSRQKESLREIQHYILKLEEGSCYASL